MFAQLLGMIEYSFAHEFAVSWWGRVAFLFEYFLCP